MSNSNIFKAIFFIFALFLTFTIPSPVSAQSACSGIALNSSGAPTASIAATDTGFLVRVTASGDEQFTRSRKWTLKDNNQTIFVATANAPQGTGIVYVFNNNQVTFVIPNSTNPSSLATGAHSFLVLSDGSPSDSCSIGPIGIANPNRTSIDACWAITGNVNIPGDEIKCEDLCTATSGPNPGTYQTEAICNAALNQIKLVNPRCDVIPTAPKTGDTITLRADNLPRNKNFTVELINSGNTTRIPAGNSGSGGSLNIALSKTLPIGDYTAKLVNSSNANQCTFNFKVVKGISAVGKLCDAKTGIQTAIGCIHTNPVALVKDLLIFIIAISGGLAFLMMLLGAFQMLTSAGNPDTLNAGKERLTNAVIGLLFIIFSILLLQIIGADILKLPDFAQ